MSALSMRGHHQGADRSLVIFSQAAVKQIGAGNQIWFRAHVSPSVRIEVYSRMYDRPETNKFSGEVKKLAEASSSRYVLEVLELSSQLRTSKSISSLNDFSKLINKTQKNWLQFGSFLEQPDSPEGGFVGSGVQGKVASNLKWRIDCANVGGKWQIRALQIFTH